MAETLRVDLCYRPLRIGWAVKRGDVAAIRQAVRYSHALWGGRFNPILIVDHEDAARRLVEVFRPDLIWPLGDAQEVKDFAKRFPHLLVPFLGDSIFIRDDRWRKHFAFVLDISNMLSHWYTKPGWKSFTDRGVRDYRWQQDDPLADVFLMQLGAYPSPDEIGADYAGMLAQAAALTTFELPQRAPIPADMPEHFGFAAVGRFGVERLHSVRTGWDAPGFFVGNAADAEDLLSAFGTSALATFRSCLSILRIWAVTQK